MVVQNGTVWCRIDELSWDEEGINCFLLYRMGRFFIEVSDEISIMELWQDCHVRDNALDHPCIGKAMVALTLAN